MQVTAPRTARPVVLRETGRETTLRQETAGQASFFTGSRMATHSTGCVIERMSSRVEPGETPGQRHSAGRASTVSGAQSVKRASWPTAYLASPSWYTRRCAPLLLVTGHSRRNADTGADLTDASAPSRTGPTTPGRWTLPRVTASPGQAPAAAAHTQAEQDDVAHQNHHTVDQELEQALRHHSDDAEHHGHGDQQAKKDPRVTSRWEKLVGHVRSRRFPQHPQSDPGTGIESHGRMNYG